MRPTLFSRLANRARLTGRRAGVAAGDLRRALCWRLGGQARLSRLLAEQDYTWIFVVGCNNSGSSLLQRMFARTGQTSTFRLEGQKHTRVLPRAHRKGYDRLWSEYAQDLTLGPELAPVLGPRLTHDWLTSVTPPRRRIIVEKTPANVLRMPFLQACFPDSRFIGLERNGYAVTEGIRRKAGHSLDRAAAHWAHVHRVLRRDAAEMDHFMLVRYEDLTDDFKACTSAMAAFTDLPADAFTGLDDASYDLHTIQGAGGRPVRNLNPPSLARLSSRDLDDIERQAGPELLQAGYHRPQPTD